MPLRPAGCVLHARKVPGHGPTRRASKASPRYGSPRPHPVRCAQVPGKLLPRAPLAAVIPLPEPLLEGLHEFAQRALCRDSGVKISKATLHSLPAQAKHPRQHPPPPFSDPRLPAASLPHPKLTAQHLHPLRPHRPVHHRHHLLQRHIESRRPLRHGDQQVKVIPHQTTERRRKPRDRLHPQPAARTVGADSSSKSHDLHLMERREGSHHRAEDLPLPIAEDFAPVHEPGNDMIHARLRTGAGMGEYAGLGDGD